MSNLLPENKKKELRKNYRLRILLVSMRFLVISLFILSIVSGSFTVILRTEIESIKHDTSNTKEADELAVSIESLRDTNKKLNILKIPNGASGPTELLQDISDSMVSGININLFEYVENDDASKTVSIAGNAVLREDLILFLEALRTHTQVDTVYSPVSNLASSANIDFTIDLEFSEKTSN